MKRARQKNKRSFLVSSSPSPAPPPNPTKKRVETKIMNIEDKDNGRVILLPQLIDYIYIYTFFFFFGWWGGVGLSFK